MQTEYLKILGVSANSSIDEIKKAFREKAKKLHPDVNKSENANEEFINLSVAYEYLINYKSNRKINKFNSNVNWHEKQKEEARQKAREYARMKYEDYLKSDHYKKFNAIENVIEILNLFFGITFVIIVAILLIYKLGFWGLIASLLISFLPIIYFYNNIKKSENLNFSTFFKSFLVILQLNSVNYFLILLFSIVIFFNFVLNTFIYLSVLLLVYIIALISSYLILFIFKKTFKYKLIISHISPFIVNIFFIINYFISKPYSIETYNYEIESSTIITLENKKYEDYIGIRTFSDFNDLHDNNKVTFTINKGLFGVMYLKTFSLH